MTKYEKMMYLLDWNRSESEQAAGRELSRDIQDLRIFLQPSGEKYDKNVWDNCARILYDRSDKELSPYLVELMEWLQDLTWPGALCILRRLQSYAGRHSLDASLNACIQRANGSGDSAWAENLLLIKNDGEITQPHF